MEEVLVSKLASAQLVELATRLEPALAVPGAATAVPPHEQWVSLFRSFDHGPWVSGRATLTTRRLLFAANVVGKIVTPGPTEVALGLGHVVGVEVRSGFLTDTVAILLPGAELRLRCWGAEALAERIGRALPGPPA